MKNVTRGWQNHDKGSGGRGRTQAASATRPISMAGAMRRAEQDVVTHGYGCLIAQASRKHGREADERSGSHG
jgi:NAD/NADP transhydrogenase beta subunit